MKPPRTFRRPKLVTTLVETFGSAAAGHPRCPLPPPARRGRPRVGRPLGAARSITIITGPPGSSFQRYAERYRTELAKNGVTLNIVPSGGSLDNLQRLQKSDSGVDVGFVQGGLVSDPPPPGIVSLGSVAYQPLWLFYRSAEPIEILSDLAGKRIGVGAPGSGVHALAHSLLELNHITRRADHARRKRLRRRRAGFPRRQTRHGLPHG